MPSPIAVSIEPTEGEREQLKSWSGRRTTAQALALRSRIVLAAAEGLSSSRIGRDLGVSVATVRKWRNRFARDRLDGLVDEPRPGRPRTITDAKVDEVIVKTLESTPYTRDFEDLTAWLAQQMNQTQVTRLMRIGWETVGNLLERVAAEKLPAGRLDGLELIGVDEVSYGADHKFLTCVANHETGGIVWATEGRNAASLQAFFDGLTDEQKASIRAVSIDMSAGYENAIRGKEGVPHAQVVFDPFHVVQLGGKAADQVRRDEYNKHGRSASGEGKWIKGTRYSLLKDPAKQTAGQLLKLAEVVTTNRRM